MRTAILGSATGIAGTQSQGRGRVKKPLPWIGQSPDLISGTHHRAIGRARLLLDLYTHLQTDRDGRVFYGKTITYGWIRKRIPGLAIKGPDSLCKRTLVRHNRMLRKGGYIETESVSAHGQVIGFRVRILRQTKFGPGVQMGLFNQPIAPPKIQGGYGHSCHQGGDRSVQGKDLRLKKQAGGNSSYGNGRRRRDR